MGEKKKAQDDGVSVRASRETRRKAKVYAAETGRTVKDVVDAAVAEYLKNESRKGR